MTIDDVQARFIFFAAHPDKGQAFCQGADMMLTTCEVEQVSRKADYNDDRYVNE